MNTNFKIGKVAEICQMPIKTIRFYEERGLVKPERDEQSGYRFFTDKQIERLFFVKSLRKQGFSLEEIKNLDEKTAEEKIAQLKGEMHKLQEKVNLCRLLASKERKYFSFFIDDPQVIGKWSAEKVAENWPVKELYFLPGGEGYWIFSRWNKGKILLYNNSVLNYRVEKNKLFVESEDEKDVIKAEFDRVDNKNYTAQQIAKKDDVNLPFEADKKMVGFWKTVGLVETKDVDNFDENKINKTSLFLKNLYIAPDGKAVWCSEGGMYNLLWTKGAIIDKNQKLVMQTKLVTKQGKEMLLMQWKSGDYVFGGFVRCWYLFEKM